MNGESSASRYLTTCGKLLSDEKRRVINFILMNADQRRIYFEALKADPGTSGPLIAVLQYLMTS